MNLLNQRNIFCFIFLFLLAFEQRSQANEEGRTSSMPARLCIKIFAKPRLSRAEITAVTVARSTPPILQMLAEESALDPESWITIVLIQDQSQLKKAPAIPGFIISLVARKAFHKKISELITESRNKNEIPRLEKMYFKKEDSEFNGIQISFSATTIIRLKIKDLQITIDSFIEAMYHPTLGNKVFKIDLVN